MRNLGKQTAYKNYHQKVSKEQADVHKQELIQTIVKMLQEDEGNYQNTIYSLLEEALQTRSIKQLKTWLE